MVLKPEERHLSIGTESLLRRADFYAARAMTNDDFTSSSNFQRAHGEGFGTEVLCSTEYIVLWVRSRHFDTN